jgi:hypothetical protein
MKGIYLLANDRVCRLAVTLAGSIRRFDPEVQIIVIPYDERSEEVCELLQRAFGVRRFADDALLAELDRMTTECFPTGSLKNPTRLRKLACWFGPLEEFLYLDCDVVVFDRVLAALDHLQQADFLWCDYQHRRLPDFVFWPSIFQEGILEPRVKSEIFNTGFLASRSQLFTLPQISVYLHEAGAVSRHLPFIKGVNDQPVLNYIVLRHVARRLNLVTLPGWRANPHPRGSYRVGDDFTLYDPAVHEPHKYLHWSGFRIEPGDPYWALWCHHHDLARQQYEILQISEERSCY